MDLLLCYSSLLFKLNLGLNMKVDSSLFLVLENHDYVLLLSSLKSFHLHFKQMDNPWNGTWLEGFVCFVNCILVPLSVSGRYVWVWGEEGNPKLPGHEEVIHGLCYVASNSLDEASKQEAMGNEWWKLETTRLLRHTGLWAISSQLLPRPFNPLLAWNSGARTALTRIAACKMRVIGVLNMAARAPLGIQEEPVRATRFFYIYTRAARTIYSNSSYTHRLLHIESTDYTFRYTKYHQILRRVAACMS